MRLRTLLLCVLPFVAWGQDPPLMPRPRSVVSGTGHLMLVAPLRLVVEGPESERVRRGGVRWKARLADRMRSDLTDTGSAGGTFVYVRFSTIADMRDIRSDGSYTLEVGPGAISIMSATDLGVLHALATLYQALEPYGDGWGFPEMVVHDSPRFIWRGLLVDVCRHFMPREMILRQLDGMELVKMNVLHLHLTEDQGFRIESKEFPELHEQGSEGNYLSQSDIRIIVHEADLRGIRVVPEFDLPGHSASWFVSHPELASAPGPYAVETRFGVFGPTFDPTQEATYTFLDRFLGEMAALFPDPYMHIGGDENNGEQWKADQGIQAYMKTHGLKGPQALQAYFNQRLYVILRTHGKRMIGWDEIGEVPEDGSKVEPLPRDITIQSWRGRDGLVSAARNGHDVVLSNGYYIDLCKSAAEHYLNDPLPDDAPLDADQRTHVLGGEATMWAELVDERNVDGRIWPRTAAIAERLWSPGAVNDVDDMYQRLEKVSAQLDAIGLRHKSGQLEILRIIAGRDEVSALKDLVDVLTPVPGYKRHSLAVHTTSTPLTSIADAAVPDPMTARRVAELIDAIIGGASLSDVSSFRYLLGTAEMSSDDLPCCQDIARVRSALGQRAMEAIDALLTPTSMGPGDCAAFQKALDEAQGPFSECLFADLPAFQRLFEAACTRPR
ncbi:MAG: family 20 glycosylhydrolase [Flavobacteriales bacterium]|nr:family 20 glycosylhydrolase [Flavobacteriales bacterium]MCB9168173.1 family 20 glycosylhydrolase [Flavobacteriales bacterium]MCB9194262.1 family 20 glycosylhydrolase [Flavobacteriales bacterium]